MARNPVRNTYRRIALALWLPGWKVSLFGLSTLVAVGCGWIYLQTQYGWGHTPIYRLMDGFGLAGLQALITFLAEQSFSALNITTQKQRYRLAFLGSCGLLAAGISMRLLSHRAYLDLPALLVGSTLGTWGAFMGGILATGSRGPLWENNSPPEIGLQNVVYHHHVQTIGRPAPEPAGKRAFDLLFSATGLLLSMPVWMLISFLVWIDDPGPVLFVKNSVGKGGRNFRQFKFRTMVYGAEDGTGPVLSVRGDRRVLRVGRFLRKVALDELPQLLNILKGEMSFVGPRPQRTVLVRGYLEWIPEYAERHAVLPGLAGLAQVAGDYYLSPRQKLRFDRLYIRYRSLGFDLKLLLLAFFITFWFRWQKEWNGRLPRQLIRLRVGKLEG